MSQNDPVGVQRGDYGRNLLSNILFSIGRGLTGPAQYLIISAHPLGRFFGIPRPPTGGFITVPVPVLGTQTQTPTHHTLVLAVPRYQALAALMPGILSLKHIFWINCLCREKVTLPFVTFAVLSDFVYETISSLVFTAASSNPMFSDRWFKIGAACFFAGALLETVADVQLALFKSKPENKGKVCKSGCWRICRQMNYTANILFGFGYGLALGGPGYSVATAGMYISNFVLNAGPGKEKYCREKYGKQWEDYEREVPYVLFPGIY